MMRAQQPTRSTPTLLGRNMLVALLAVCGPLVAAVPAQQVRYIQQNGVAYRETRQTGYRTICTTEMRPSQRIVYREQCETQTREVTRTWWTPVIECRWEAQWVNRWNPFAQPYLVYRPVERVRWEQRRGCSTGSSGGREQFDRRAYRRCCAPGSRSAAPRRAHRMAAVRTDALSARADDGWATTG